MRLIDAEELIHELSKSKVLMIVDDDSNYNYIRQSDVFKIVDSAPTIEERKKGRWLNKGRKIVCSVCGRTNFCRPNFCEECGADNREEKTDE